MEEFLELEDLNDAANLKWVVSENERTLQEVSRHFPDVKDLQAKLKAVMDSKDRIPLITRRGPFVYNFWEDEKNPRGVWRRVAIEEFQRERPNWEPLLEIDALNAAENKQWTYHAAAFNEQTQHALISLSVSGSDSHVVREFDVEKKQFLDASQKPFEVELSKSSVQWFDADTVCIADGVEEENQTESGYPRVCRIWKRGQSRKEAQIIFEADKKSVSAYVNIEREGKTVEIIVGQHITFYENEDLWYKEGKLHRLVRPNTAKTSTLWRDHLLLELREDWGPWKAGALLAAPLSAVVAPGIEASPELLEKACAAMKEVFVPTETRFLEEYTLTHSSIVVTILDNVVSQLEQYTLGANGSFTKSHVQTPSPGMLAVSSWRDFWLDAANDVHADTITFRYSDFITPTTLYLLKLDAADRKLVTLKSLPPMFDATGMKLVQYHATSKDGTKIPYFVAFPKNFVADGSTATFLYGYGGFEVTLTPYYSGVIGNSILARGGVYVVANIRGGGEFGPRWHQSALREKRQRCYDDFISVAEDLIARKITSPAHLSILGESNGGLLVGAVMVQRPDLFRAVMSGCPLLDMKRYTKLTAGASWKAEYGDPDVEDDWKFISTFSPFHNIGKDVPYVIFSTTTADDRVHPSHARRMHMKLKAKGLENKTFLFENTEGGHGAGSDNSQRALKYATEYAFLWGKLK